MRVLILSQYFPPEVGAGQTRVHTFAAGLAARGHDVEVICEVPNHPQGVVHDGYGGRLLDRRGADGFYVSYVWVRARPGKTMLNRLGAYGSYVLSGAVAGVLSKRPDAIFASSPPLPVGLPAAAAALRHRVPWVLDVRDLWPQAAVAMGELGNERVIAAAERLERGLYRAATAITTVTEPFRRHIEGIAPPGKRIELLPNGTTRLWTDAAELRVDRAALDLPEDRFLVTYAGTLGAAQGLEPVIDAAGLLDERFQLLVVGDGAMRPALEQRARALPPGRVVFHDLVPPEEATKYLRASDCLIVSLAADPGLAPFVPSKLFDYCAVGRPVVLAAAGESRRLAEAAGAALAVEPGDPAALAAAIRRLQEEPELAERLSDAGRAFGAANLRDVQVDRLDALLGELVRRPTPAGAPS
jgi:glycosyltransferase involved in cell wall biosynthesis